MGFISNVADRVRGFFRQDKEQLAVNMAKGSTSSGYPASGYDLLQAYGYDVLSDYLKLEHDLLCLSGDSRVLVLNDGPEWVPIRSLAEKYKDKPEEPIYTLSFDRKSKRVVCSKAYRPRKTLENAQVFYVVMTGSATCKDESYVIKATANHPFLMRDGQTYKRVDELRPGDSVMPAGLSLKKSVNGPYWYVFQPFELTCTGKHSKQEKLAGLVVECTQGHKPNPGEVVHHKNGNKHCDAPWNLEVKPISEHHGEHSKALWSDVAWRKEQVRRVSLAKSGGVPKTVSKRGLGSKAGRISIDPEGFLQSVRESASVDEVARRWGINWWTARSRMEKWSISVDELGSRINHRVVAILPAGSEDVYDLTVPEYENFAAEGVIVHNSRYVDYEEMDDIPEVSSALTIYADDATVPETQINRSIWVESQQASIQQLLDDLVHKTLRMDEEVWEIGRSLCKYGSNFEELLVTNEGVKGLNFLPAPTVRRIEGPRGELFGFVQDHKGRFGYSPQEFQQVIASRAASKQGGGDKQGYGGLEKIAALEDWEVVHMRLRSKHRRSIYGYSVLESARWIFKRLMLMEDAALIYRLQRAPERYAFYVDVGDLPPAEALAYLNKVRQQHRKTKFFNPTSNKIDLKHNPLPVSATTPIPLLDGRVLTIEEMAKEHAEGKKHWVYSIDPETKKFVPGEVSWVGRTREDAVTLRITFDDGGHADMAPDHPVMLRTGEYIYAQDLKPDDSLMPFYRSSKRAGDKDTYEIVYDPCAKDYVLTYRRVAETIYGVESGDGRAVHHLDFSKNNNNPENLAPVLKEDHVVIHRKANPELDAVLRLRSKENITAYNKSSGKRIRTALLNLERDQGRFIRAYNLTEKHAQDNVIRRECKKAMWLDPERREKAQENMRLKFPEEFTVGLKALVRSNPDLNANQIVDAINSHLLMLVQGANRRTVPQVHRHMMLAYYRSLGFKDFKDFKITALKEAVQHGDNHKVVSVTRIENCDQYCMTVEKWHNFALCLKALDGATLAGSGIYVRNSQDEDFFIPSRKGSDSTRVEVLAAPNWQHMEDIEYFRDKLFAAIGIPKAYMGQEEGVSRGILSSQDVRFARSVLRVQREIRNGIGKVCRVHMAALNIDPYAVDFDIRMTVPSAIFELAQLEVRNARADLANRMKEFVSHHWLLSNVFGFNDSDIQKVIMQRENDTQQDVRHQVDFQSAMMQAQSKFQDQMLKKQAATQLDMMKKQQDLTIQAQIDAQRQAAEAEAQAGQTESLLSPCFGATSPYKYVPRYHALTEKELFNGNKEADKKASDKLETILKNDKKLAARLLEVGSLLQDLRANRSTR